MKENEENYKKMLLKQTVLQEQPLSRKEGLKILGECSPNPVFPIRKSKEEEVASRKDFFFF
jgi:hypothetical protein